MPLGNKLTHERAMRIPWRSPRLRHSSSHCSSVLRGASRIDILREDILILRLVECDSREFLFRPSFGVVSLEVEAPVSPLRL
jgi:hypothetical protein